MTIPQITISPEDVFPGQRQRLIFHGQTGHLPTKHRQPGFAIIRLRQIRQFRQQRPVLAKMGKTAKTTPKPEEGAGDQQHLGQQRRYAAEEIQAPPEYGNPIRARQMEK
jgi:hypothetical protein